MSKLVILGSWKFCLKLGLIALGTLIGVIGAFLMKSTENDLIVYTGFFVILSSITVKHVNKGWSYLFYGAALIWCLTMVLFFFRPHIADILVLGILALAVAYLGWLEKSKADQVSELSKLRNSSQAFKEK